MCYGVANMFIQASLLGEDNVFEKRIALMAEYRYHPELLVRDIKNVHEKLMGTVEKKASYDDLSDRKKIFWKYKRFLRELST